MIDENTTNILRALAPQQDRAGVNQIVMQLLSSALQPKPTPEDQLRELFAQSRINAGDFQGALDTLNAQPDQLRNMFSGTGGVSAGETSVINSQLESLIQDTEDPTKQLKLSKLAEDPTKAKKYVQYEGDKGTLGSRLKSNVERDSIFGIGGSDILDILFGGRTKQQSKDKFLDQLVQ